MSGTRYVQYTAREVRDILVCASFKEVRLPRVQELVFERDSNNKDILIRVYSSIGPDGQGRKSGSDAGRVILLDRISQKPVWKSKRVHRTKNFLENLLQRCRDAYKAVSVLQTCPVCKGFMIERKRKGEAKPSFYGCLSYPKCKGTKSFTR